MFSNSFCEGVFVMHVGTLIIPVVKYIPADGCDVQRQQLRRTGADGEEFSGFYSESSAFTDHILT